MKADALYGLSRERMDREILGAFGVTTSQIAVDSPPLTAEALLAAVRDIAAVPAVPRVVFTATALKLSSERLFPPSPHRSERIRKKLVKRHGGEFRLAPAMWQVGDVVYAHPFYRAHFNKLPVASPRQAQSVSAETHG